MRRRFFVYLPGTAFICFVALVGSGYSAAVGKESIPARASDSTEKSQPGPTTADSISTGAQIYQYIAYPTLQVLTWPVEKLLVPVVRAISYPVQAPIRYFLNENVIDGVRELVTYGEGEKLLIYPTMNVAPGTGSRTGVTLRDKALFGRDTEKLTAYALLYVNADYKVRTYMTAENLLGTRLQGKMGVGIVRMKNSATIQPGTGVPYYYSDTSETYQFQVQHPLAFGFQGLLNLNIRQNRYGGSPTPTDSSVVGNGFFRNNTGAFDGSFRGIGQTFLDRSWGIGIGRDTRNNENITLAGSWMDLGWSYHDVGLGHSFHNWGGQYTTYFKLGEERYEITAAEERLRGELSMDKFLEKLEYRKIRDQIFSRKVVLMRIYLAQSLEIPGNNMPVYGLQSLGNDTPLRGYAGARFRDYTVAAITSEYRFPVLRLMDGTIFNEYGVIGKNWAKINYLDYKNSWGFGIRVRQPDIYLFRIELGIHGLSGVTLNMSVDAPF